MSIQITKNQTTKRESQSKTHVWISKRHLAVAFTSYVFLAIGSLPGIIRFFSSSGPTREELNSIRAADENLCEIAMIGEAFHISEACEWEDYNNRIRRCECYYSTIHEGIGRVAVLREER